ncbi:MAG TPA: alkaline phosphatase D family protein [Fimbriiglobus sp.]|nr:alkaline phosphatase D family protein [Fimbriiglobus sp.]
MPRLSWWVVSLLALCPTARGQDAVKPLARVAFGSCADQTKPCPVWTRIAEQKPDLLVLLGDNVYTDIEDGKLVPANPAKIAKCYRELAAIPAFQSLRKLCPVLTTWDDHDYGTNDGDVNYPHKEESRRLFLDFWGVPANSPRRQRPGIYHAETFGPPGKRVQVILLDGRSFRSKIETAAQPLPGTRIRPYLPNTEKDATFLGDAQWKWLEQQLRQPAELRLLCSGIQVVSDEHPFEKWANIPAERERLYRLIRETNANGVVVLSGDRHLGELSLDADAAGYPLYDLTASGLNQATKAWRATEKNGKRVAGMPYGDHFGLVTVDWAAKDPVVSLQLRDDAGEVVFRQAFPLSLLKARGEPVVKLPEGVIGPEQARRMLGQEVTVQFPVRGGRAVGMGKRILLNSEPDFRSERNFTVVVNEKAMTGRFEKATFAAFKDKTIRAKGKVTKYEDQLEISVEDAKQLEIVEKK